MFCNKCGESNKDYSNYCLNDGESLKKINEKVEMKKIGSKFCNNCGSSVNKSETYCSNCGTSQFNLSEKKSKVDISESINKDRIHQKINLKSLELDKVIKVGAISFFAVFIMSFMISFGLNLLINDFLQNNLIALENKNLINVIDLTLLSNFVDAKLSAIYSGGEVGSLSFKGALFPLALIPVIVFIITGIIISNKDIKKERTINITNILSSGLVYGLLLGILAIIGRFVFKVPYLDIEIDKSFYILNAIFNGTIISSVSILFGYAVNTKIKKREELFLEYDFLLNAIFNFMIFLIITVVVLSIFLMGEIDTKYSYNTRDIMIVLMAIYQSCIMFLGLNFGTLSIRYSNDYIPKLSLFKISQIKSIYGEAISNILLISLLIPITIFFLTGRKIKRKYGQNMSKVVYTSAVYSVLVGILSYMTKMAVETSGSFASLDLVDFSFISVGFNTLGITITSFVFSFIVTLAGYLLTSVDGFNNTIKNN